MPPGSDLDAKSVGDLIELTMMATFDIAMPVLLVGLAVGVFISIIQAATQVNEVTLVFIPKMIAVGVMMWMTGSDAVAQLHSLFLEIARHVQEVSQVTGVGG